MDFSGIEKNLGYSFKNKELLRRALTLASYDNDFNNQNLEFFGDAVLEFIVSEKIFDQSSDEGKMTERRKTLVSDDALTPVSLKLGLDKFLIKSSGDNKNKKAIPSAYEAVAAAIYLDGGMDAARNFVYSTLDFTVKPEPDYKSELQILLQKSKWALPNYDKSTQDVGTAQKPKSRCKIKINGKTFTGVADNKQQAQKNAARLALQYFKKKSN
ncbi:MAG: hypothetical protein HFE41_00750 [Clostridia bacterium]|jgi:ribonuclease-3|nr:hypothetical protein [Clostridia bacterium]